MIYFQRVLKNWLFVIIGFTIISCEKNAEFKPENTLFNGDSIFKGVVYFRNVTSNSLDTAKTAKLTIKRLEADFQEEYITVLKDGSFDIQFLQAGKYQINSRYEHKSKSNELIIYEGEETIDIAENQTIDNHKIVLEVNSSLIDSPTLRISIKESTGAVIANAQVCLYSDSILLIKNKFTCLGSTKSGITNQQGIVLFDELEERKYFVTAFKIIGKDTLSINPLSPISVGPLKKGIINESIFSINF